MAGTVWPGEGEQKNRGLGAYERAEALLEAIWFCSNQPVCSEFVNGSYVDFTGVRGPAIVPRPR